MNFLVDAQLPQTLADFLTSKGHPSVHTMELTNKNNTSDTTIVDIAESQGRVIITKDDDFLQMHVIKNKPTKLLIVKTGNISNKELLFLFDQYLDQIVNYLQSYCLIEMYSTELIVQ